MAGGAVEPRIPIARACGTVLPFGKHKGQTIARVGSSDTGLAYLVWLSKFEGTVDRHPFFSAQLNLYLAEASIAKRVETLGLSDE